MEKIIESTYCTRLQEININLSQLFEMQAKIKKLSLALSKILSWESDKMEIALLGCLDMQMQETKEICKTSENIVNYLLESLTGKKYKLISKFNKIIANLNATNYTQYKEYLLQLHNYILLEKFGKKAKRSEKSKGEESM